MRKNKPQCPSQKFGENFLGVILGFRGFQPIRCNLKIDKNGYRTETTGVLRPIFGIGMFFGVRKPMIMSKFKIFKILTPFVTSQTPNLVQNGQKTT